MIPERRTAEEEAMRLYPEIRAEILNNIVAIAFTYGTLYAKRKQKEIHEKVSGTNAQDRNDGGPPEDPTHD